MRHAAPSLHLPVRLRCTLARCALTLPLARACAEMHQMLPAIFGFLSLRERGRAAVVRHNLARIATRCC